MSKTTKIDLARAGKEELVDYIEKSGTTIDPELPIPQLREKAMEIQQSLVAMKEDDNLEKRAKAASSKILNDGEEDEDDEDEGTQIARVPAQKRSKKLDIDSLEVQPHDGESASINEIVDQSRRSRGGEIEETIAEKVLKEQKAKKDNYNTARLVVAADAEINEYHLDAMQRHKAKLTNICFFLLKGTNLSTLTTPYTKIQGVRLRKETPYRALDVELKFFRSKRGMFGECEYYGDDLVDNSTATKGKKNK